MKGVASFKMYKQPLSSSIPVARSVFCTIMILNFFACVCASVLFLLNVETPIILLFKGGKQRGLHNYDLELPPPARQHPLNAEVDLDHISPGDQHFFKINPNDKVFDNVQSFNTTTHPPTQWLPWILRMSRPGRPLTKKSIQLQVIDPSIVFFLQIKR